MSVEPDQDTTEFIEEARPPRPWHSRLLGIIFVIFCFEVGVVLLIFPWIDSWNGNYLSDIPQLRDIWENLYFRGALSGVGMVNIYISFTEMFRIMRGNR